MLEFKSISDFGYSQAVTSDSLKKQAQWAVDNMAGFPSDISDETKAELFTGYRRRYSENHGATVYAVINGHYVTASDEHIQNKAVEKISASVEYAMAFSSQEFGKLKNTEPEKHAIIAKIREAVQTYCSNRLADLKREANKLIKGETSRTRTTLDFVESCERAFEALEKSVKVKVNKGDTTANVAKFKAATKAFWTTYNK